MCGNDTMLGKYECEKCFNKRRRGKFLIWLLRLSMDLSFVALIFGVGIMVGRMI